ncbi:hypothetical protein JZ751_014872, partial [Albula glossodonta]
MKQQIYALQMGHVDTPVECRLCLIRWGDGLVQPVYSHRDTTDSLSSQASERSHAFWMNYFPCRSAGLDFLFEEAEGRMGAGPPTADPRPDQLGQASGVLAGGQEVVITGQKSA